MNSDIDKLIADGTLNGCGPSGWKSPLPSFCFEHHCYEHDYAYYVGGSETDRRSADNKFYYAMVRCSNYLSWWKRPFARLQAWVYYRMVKSLGSKYFNYADA